MVEQNNSFFVTVGGHSLSVKNHTFCCLNALNIYETNRCWNRSMLSFSSVGGHSLSVRYNTFCCSNTLTNDEQTDGAAEQKDVYV